MRKKNIYSVFHEKAIMNNLPCITEVYTNSVSGNYTEDQSTDLQGDDGICPAASALKHTWDFLLLSIQGLVDLS